MAVLPLLGFERGSQGSREREVLRVNDLGDISYNAFVKAVTYIHYVEVCDVRNSKYQQR